MTAPPGYELIEHLSRGRRLDVYDAWSAERGCRCVLKTLRPERAGESKARSLLLEEGRLLLQLAHPHLVRAYEVFAEPVPTVVLETLSGRTLAHVIADGPALAPVEVAQLGLHLGSAARYLHAHGVLHLDLKPANVVADAGRAKLIDLSVARAPGPAEPGVGTPDYMAPEQARGGDLTAAADVWGLGLVLHEAATREACFVIEGEDASESQSWTWTSESGAGEEAGAFDEDDYLQLTGRAPLLAGTDRLPEDFAALIDSCLEPDPAARPALAEVLAGLEEPAGLPDPERRWSRDRASS